MSTVKEIVNNMFITYHAVERFFERFPKLVAENKINKNVDVQGFRNTSFWRDYLRPALENSMENRSLHNDTNRMVNFYERYGYDHAPLYLDNVELRARFVFTKKQNHYVLVTILAMDIDKVRLNLKYGANKSKENAPTMMYDTLVMKNAPIPRKESKSISMDKSGNLSVVAKSNPVEKESVKEKIEDVVVADVQKDGKVIYTNPGKVKDENGYFMTGEEKLQSQSVNLNISFAVVNKAIKKKFKALDLSALVPDALGFYSSDVEVGDYLVGFKSRIGSIGQMREIEYIKDLTKKPEKVA